MNFGYAVEALKAGKKARREKWSDTGAFLFLIESTAIEKGINDQCNGQSKRMPVEDAIWIRSAKGRLVPWTPTQHELLSEDWETID